MIDTRIHTTNGTYEYSKGHVRKIRGDLTRTFPSLHAWVPVSRVDAIEGQCMRVVWPDASSTICNRVEKVERIRGRWRA